MLGKLMKYEIKATARWFLPLYAGMLLFALINKLFFTLPMFQSYDNNLFAQYAEIPKMLALSVYIFIIIATFVVTFIVMLQRFYKNLLGDEGYLMFTLPVQPWKNILNKLLVSMMWTILSGFFALLSIFILMIDRSILVEIPDAFLQLMRLSGSELGINGGVLLLELFALLLISIAMGILQVYCSIAIGQLCNNHKLLASVGAFIGINIAMQTASSVISFPFLWRLSSISFEAAVEVGCAINGVLLFSMALSLVFGLLFYFATHLILTYKLNLE